MTEAVATDERYVSEVTDIDVNMGMPVFVGGIPKAEEIMPVKAPDGFRPAQRPSVEIVKLGGREYAIAVDAGQHWLTDEERRFVVGLQDTLIAERKFFESLFTVDVGTPYTLGLLAPDQRPYVREFVIARYLFNNGIHDDYGILPIEGEVRRHFAMMRGGSPWDVNFTYNRTERYCRDSGFSEGTTQEILTKASKIFAARPEFYGDTSFV